MKNEVLEIVKKGADNEDNRAPVCKYCNTEMVTDPAKEPYDRIRENLTSSRYEMLKTSSQETDKAGTSQLTLFDASCAGNA